jgi:hypothetical protein
VHSDFIIYVDESGDHGLENIDPEYPIFVLAFCLFEKSEYRKTVVPAFLDLKFSVFGHDMVVLHSHDIRKGIGHFKALFDRAKRDRFNDLLSAAITAAPFTVVASVIDKQRLRRQYAHPDNPYAIALTFCMERAHAFLRDRRQHQANTCIVVESRGRVEDSALELAFRRIVQGANRWGPVPFELLFADKRANSTGLQIADLVAHPIGRHHLRPDQPNRAYDVVEPKFRRSGTGIIDGWGRKIFP